MSMPEASAKKSAGKASRFDAWAIAGTALVAVLVVLVNYISFRRYERFDLTRDRLFTLSERTDKLLNGLQKPVDVTIFLGSNEPSFHELRELLLRYQAKTDKLRVQFVDPDREPTKFRVLAEKSGVRVGVQENGQAQAELAVLVSSGDKRWSITRDDLVELDYDSLGGEGGQKAKVNVKTEQALSGAIVQVTSGRATKVCITDGHGEWTLDAGGERALLAMKEELGRENITLEALTTRGKRELPKECDAIFVLGPVKAFTEDESAALKRYVDDGGNLLLALDPIISGEELQLTGLEELTQAYGVQVANAVTVELDESRWLTPSPVEAFIAKSFGDHKVVRPLNALGAPVVFALSRPLRIGEGSRAEALIKSSDKAYGESALAQLAAGDDFKAGEGDVAGPVTLAAIVETRPQEEGKPPQQGGRVIVVGDSDWLSPQLLRQAEVANIDLLSSVTGYLTERQALVAIAPRKIDAQAILITEEALFWLFLRVVVFMPLAALVLGVGMWWQRRE